MHKGTTIEFSKRRMNNMKTKPFLMKILLCILSCISFIYPSVDQSSDDMHYQTKLNPEKKLGIVRHRSPVDYSFIHNGKLTILPHYNPTSDNPRQVDLRSTDVSAIDLSDSLNDLLFACFDSKTRWPKRLPEGFIPDQFMELGKNPGLGIRQLHRQGITGKGIGLAIIDKGLLVDHVEYKDRLRLYEEIHCYDETSMHGPAVASIAVGKTIGVAPEADLYYIGEDHGIFKKEGFDRDFSYLARAIERFLAINQELPENKKIRVISVSVGWDPKHKGYNEMMTVVEKAKKAGIFIISSSLDDCYGHKFLFEGLGRAPLSDPDQFALYTPCIFLGEQFYKFSEKKEQADMLLIPMDSRCTASPTGYSDYAFYRQGGWSWIVPYLAGLYALACQVNPKMTPEIFWQNALSTGETININSNQVFKLGKIVNPLKLITILQEKK
jgi:hypothetical protein